MRPTLTPNIFVTENGRKSDFPPARNPTTSPFDVLSYGDFGFISWGNQEKKNGAQILNSTTRTIDPCRVGQSTFHHQLLEEWKRSAEPPGELRKGFPSR